MVWKQEHFFHGTFSLSTRKIFRTRDPTPAIKDYRIVILQDCELICTIVAFSYLILSWDVIHHKKDNGKLTRFPIQSPWPGQHKNVPPLQDFPFWEHPALASKAGPASAAAKAARASRAMKYFMLEKLGCKGPCRQQGMISDPRLRTYNDGDRGQLSLYWARALCLFAFDRLWGNNSQIWVPSMSWKNLGWLHWL